MPNAIVFGATSGIGKQLAEFLINDGYKVAITGRRNKLLTEIKNSNPDNYISKQTDLFGSKKKKTKSVHFQTMEFNCLGLKNCTFVVNEKSNVKKSEAGRQ